MNKIGFLLALLQFTAQYFCVAQVNWVKNHGPAESNITYLTCSEGIWYTAGYDVQYSNDDGLTWQVLPGSEYVYDLNYYSVIYTPNMQEVDVSGSTAFAWLNVGQTVAWLYSNHSTGDPWMQVPFTPFKISGRESLVQFGDTVIAAAKEGNQYRLAWSGNGGEDWALKPDDQGWVSAYGLYRSGDKLYMVNNQGNLWVSDATADDWALVFKANTTLPYSIKNPVFSGDIIASTTFDNSKLVVSYDGGQNWQVRDAPAGNQFIAPQLCADGALIYASRGNHAFFVSQDTVQNWVPLAMNGFPLPDWVVNYWHVANGTMIAQEYTTRTMYRSTDGGQSFQSVSPLLVSPLVYDFDRSNDTWFVCTKQAFYRSVDAGQHWTIPNIGGNSPGIVAAAGNFAIAGANQTLFYSTNKGLYWSPISITPHEIAASETAMYYTSFDKVFRFTNDLGWVQLSIPPVPGINFFINLSVDDSNILLVADKSYILRSYDMGETWQVISDSSFTGKTMNGASLIDNMEYVAANGVLYRRDANSNWQHLWKLPPVEVDSTYIDVSFHRRGDKLLAFFFGGGCYVSPDTGATWIEYPYLPGPERLRYAYLDDQMVALSMSGGLFYTTDSFNIELFGGRVFEDSNMNGSYDSSELLLPQVIVSDEAGKRIRTTDADGHYRYLFSTEGADTIFVVPPCKYCQVIPPGYRINAPGDTFDFAIQVEPEITDLAVDLTNTTPVRPGFESDFVLTYQNIGTDTATATVYLELPDYFSFINATPLPSGSNGNQFEWSVGPLVPEESGQINIRLKLSDSQVPGEEIYAIATIVPDNIDRDPSDNTDTLRMISVGSYDPNDKTVNPSDPIDIDRVIDTLSLVYTIRFQNTGNYPAEVVRIADTLPETVKATTFHLLAASHPVQWKLEDDGVLTFTFNNIFLPDSSQDEMASHGFVKFSIKARPDLNVGDTIANRAGIYFDFNIPVITNQAENPIVEVVSLQEEEARKIDFEVRPTLASQFISLTNNESTATRVVIVQSGGKIVADFTLEATSSLNLNVDNWQSGIYYVTVLYPDGRMGAIAMVKIGK